MHLGNRKSAITSGIRQIWAEQLARYASPFARVALDNIARAYPNQPGHVLLDASGLIEPKELHPVFYGSYDWHSAVHMHWMLVSLLTRFPDLPEAGEIRNRLDGHFTSENIEAELSYFQQAGNRAFERTYGWAWLLKLQTALICSSAQRSDIDHWGRRLQPLAAFIAQAYLEFLPLAQFPIRAGVHGNSAFALLFALEYGRTAGHEKLANAVVAKALAWFGRDGVYPAQYEPNGDDFLSGGLLEAVLMHQVLNQNEFARWWKNFCPEAAALKTWLMPLPATDRSDSKLAHLDGLNLSRAWCWGVLYPALPHPSSSALMSAIDSHLAASLPFSVQGNYAGTHWLASFALLAFLALVETA